MSEERYKKLSDCDDNEIKSEFHRMSDDGKRGFFAFNMARANTDIVLMLMDEGMVIAENEFSLHTPASKKNCFKFFKALHERGVNLRCGGDILMFKACLNDNTPSLDTIMFLGSLIPEQDSRGAYLSFLNIMYKNLDNKNADGKLTKNCEAVMEYMATKLSAEKMRECANLVSQKSHTCPKNSAFLSKKAFYLALNKGLAQSTDEQNEAEVQQATKMKI